MANIELTRGEIALIDDDMYEYLSQWKWYCAVPTIGRDLKYAVRKVANPDKTWTRYFMHRVLLDPIPEGMIVDHINGNGLDNRKSNLRIVTYTQNSMNRKMNCRNKSGHSGVRWHNRSKTWEASIRIDGIWTYLGSSTDKEEAIKIRKLAEEKYYGQFLRGAVCVQ